MENAATSSKQPATWFQVLRTISLRLLGIHSRKNKEDIPQISVKQAFIGGIIGVIIFMIFVVFLVTLAIEHFS